jgi:hypothetical protein
MTTQARRCRAYEIGPECKCCTHHTQRRRWWIMLNLRSIELSFYTCSNFIVYWILHRNMLCMLSHANRCGDCSWSYATCILTITATLYTKWLLISKNCQLLQVSVVYFWYWKKKGLIEFWTVAQWRLLQCKGRHLTKRNNCFLLFGGNFSENTITKLNKLDLYLKNNIWNNLKISFSLSMCTFCVEDAEINSILLSLFSLLLFNDSHNWGYNFTKNRIEWDMQHHKWHKVTYTYL